MFLGVGEGGGWPRKRGTQLLCVCMYRAMNAMMVPGGLHERVMLLKGGLLTWPVVDGACGAGRSARYTKPPVAAGAMCDIVKTVVWLARPPPPLQAQGRPSCRCGFLLTDPRAAQPVLPSLTWKPA